MSQELRVASPPPKPLLVYDGDCNFCRRSVSRWKRICRDALDCAPLQDESLYARFPELSRESCEQALHLIAPDGAVVTGAEAAFRSLYECDQERWLYRAYRRFPSLAELSEMFYEEIAGHREFVSAVDRVFSGPGVAPLTYIWSRFVFLRGLAIIYLIAFASLAGQIRGLCGHDGIAPTQTYMQALRAQAKTAHLGWVRYYLTPTFAWLNSSDGMLTGQCYAGIVLSVLLLLGIAPAPVLFLLWCIYLSLCTSCGPFLEFQWDQLLLETGFLAMLFAPRQWWERPSRQSEPSLLAVWLLRWLLFRLMLESGCVKLLSGDISWWNLSALRYHFQTQPLPTPVAWYAHLLSPHTLAFCTVILFCIELIGPALILCGRKSRAIAAGMFIFLQILIMLTGNYTFFNWLAILLCLPLLDDDLLFFRRRPLEMPAPPAIAPRATRWPRWIMAPVAVMIFMATSVSLLIIMGVPTRWAPSIFLFEWAQPLRSFNNYGLFAVMTRTRPEIIVQGSRDGKNWLPYEFKYKPGDLKTRPKFVAPYQPRLDWQMWFAALDPRENPWFLSFETHLLLNTPSVTALLAENPFSNAPPKYVRSLLYDYSFTDAAMRQVTGQWWQRKFINGFVPPISLTRAKTPAPAKSPPR